MIPSFQTLTETALEAARRYRCRGHAARRAIRGAV